MDPVGSTKFFPDHVPPVGLLMTPSVALVLALLPASTALNIAIDTLTTRHSGTASISGRRSDATLSPSPSTIRMGAVMHSIAREESSDELAPSPRRSDAATVTDFCYSRSNQVRRSYTTMSNLGTMHAAKTMVW